MFLARGFPVWGRAIVYVETGRSWAKVIKWGAALESGDGIVAIRLRRFVDRGIIIPSISVSRPGRGGDGFWGAMVKPLAGSRCGEKEVLAGGF